MSDNPTLLNAYKEANRILRQKEVYIGHIVTLILVPAGFVLDYIYYPEYFFELVIIRAICVLVLLLLYPLNFTAHSHKQIWFLGLVLPLVVNTAVCFLIYTTEGVMSSYYAGLNLAIIGAALVLPLTLTESILILIYTLFIYIITVTLYEPDIFSSKFQTLFNNLYFILLTGIIAAVASYMGEKQRFREFSLRYELDKRNKKLAEVDRMKSDFFANISHELRTPLTLILSPLEDLLQSNQPFDFKVNQMLSTARDNGYRLLKLVNDLLSIIRLDDKNAILNCKPLELNTLLQGVVHSMQHLAEKQQIKLESKVNFESAIINGNTSALEKIFINLINNAIKFTPKNGLIQVNSHTNTEGTTISIKDTGIGISKSDLPHIFERFNQADSSATRKYQGTGLGLALVNELTLAHGGTVEVESKLEKGTTITLFFPPPDTTSQKSGGIIAPPQDNVTMESNPLEKIHQKADYSLHLNKPNTTILEPIHTHNENTESLDQRAKLLIVEDEPDLRSYLVNSLSDSYHVFSAADGKAGLDLAVRHSPDLALLDLMLPEIDGLELCKIIKNTETLQFTKVVLLTARIDDESKITALKNGADDFLTKPFSTTEVKTRLTNLWKSGQLERRLESHNQQLSQALTDLKAMESQLIHSEKMSAIGKLAAGLLHEVNNPLNYAITAVQILQRESIIKEDDDLAEMVDDIFEGMERILLIVKDLHTFAYPKTADKNQPFRLLDTVKSALRFTASEHKGFTINVNITEDIIVLGSNSHIVQVLINLITNAIKATQEEDEAIITIDSTPMTNDHNRTERTLIRVHDNGSGISEEAASHIFEPFFTTRDVGEGLGMGLSICHTIIENHDGTINVNSEVGKYTEFSFDLATS